MRITRILLDLVRSKHHYGLVALALGHSVGSRCRRRRCLELKQQIQRRRKFKVRYTQLASHTICIRLI